MSGCTLCYGGWAGRAGQQILCRVGSQVNGRGDQTVGKRASWKGAKGRSANPVQSVFRASQTPPSPGEPSKPSTIRLLASLPNRKAQPRTNDGHITHEKAGTK